MLSLPSLVLDEAHTGKGLQKDRMLNKIRRVGVPAVYFTLCSTIFDLISRLP